VSAPIVKVPAGTTSMSDMESRPDAGASVVGMGGGDVEPAVVATLTDSARARPQPTPAKDTIAQASARTAFKVG